MIDPSTLIRIVAGVDGELSPEELRRLEQEMADDPELRRVFSDMLRQRLMLSELMAAPAPAAADGARRRRLMVLLAAAAALLLVLGVSIFLAGRGPGRAQVVRKPPVELPAARLTRIRGEVRYARGETQTWTEATEGARLRAGDRFETRLGAAVLEMGGARIFVNRSTRLRLLAAAGSSGDVPLLNLAVGEVYIRDAGARVHVETADGLFSPVGTRFDVKRSQGATLVAVEEGSVYARAKTGKAARASPPRRPSRVNLERIELMEKAVRIAAGQLSRVARGAAPGAPAPGHVPLAWVRRLEPAPARPITGETLLADFGAGDRSLRGSRVKASWTNLRFTKTGAAPGKKFAARANQYLGQHAQVMVAHEDSILHIASRGMTLRVRCRVDRKAQLGLYLVPQGISELEMIFPRAQSAVGQWQNVLFDVPDDLVGRDIVDITVRAVAAPPPVFLVDEIAIQNHAVSAGTGAAGRKGAEYE